MTFLALLRVWVLILLAMIANGAMRELALVRLMPAQSAEIVSATIGIAIILTMTRFLLRPIAGRSVPAMIGASATLVLLTAAFDLMFGHYVAGTSWRMLAAQYEIWNGRPWLAVLGTLAFMPFLWGRWALPAPHFSLRRE